MKIYHDVMGCFTILEKAMIFTTIHLLLHDIVNKMDTPNIPLLFQAVALENRICFHTHYLI